MDNLFSNLIKFKIKKSCFENCEENKNGQEGSNPI